MAESPILLYSVNPFIKYLIQREYRNDIHFVWCSHCFDSTKVHQHSRDALLPPSSNPAELYKKLSEDVKRGDRHSDKIKEQKASIIDRAVKWAFNGEITPDSRDEIVFRVEHADFAEWRPMIYVIPYGLVGDRAEVVPAKETAGWGTEYRIADLRGAEFHLIESL